MGKPDPPTPPNPIQTAAAATGTNVGTAVANAFLNNTNQVTPQGSLTYDQTSTYQWNDPTTGQTYNIPRFTATQALSPEQQNIANLGTQTGTNLAQLAVNQSGMLTNLLGHPMDTHSWPTPPPGIVEYLQGNPQPEMEYADVGGQQRALGDTGQQDTSFGEAGDITGTYGGADDFSEDRRRVEESLYQRMDPQLQRDRANMEARLADQGIKIGSPAHQAAMDQFDRQLTDTRLGIVQAGGAEQTRMMDMAAKRAGFENAAQMQRYQQMLGRGTFKNAAQAQQFAEELQTGTFANQAQAADYQQAALRAQFKNAATAQKLQQAQVVVNAQNERRKNYLGELYQERNQPINEISALLSGSQVQNPSYVNTPTNQIATTDIAGLINNNFSQNMQNYTQQSNNFNQLMGGMFGMMGGMLRSDRREKENIDRMGTIFAAGVKDVDHDEIKPLPIYQYSYKDDPASTRHIGPMAQDVEKIDRRAVKTVKGTKYIDTTRMGSILRAA